MSDERIQDQPPEVLPVEKPHRKPLICWYCGSDDITKGVKLAQQRDFDSIGLSYRTSGEFLGISMLGVEPLRFSLCNECGTVVRLSVKETERDWT